MHKRNMMCSAVLCLLLILSSCSAGVNGTTPPASTGTAAPVDTVAATATAGGGISEGLLDTLCSVSDAFLKVHYGVTVNQAEEYAQWKAELDNKLDNISPLPTLGVYNLKDLDPDLAERFEILIKQKYQTQPLTDNGLKSIESLSLCQTLWKLVLSEKSDIEIISVKSSLRKTQIDDKRNYMKYTINLLVNKTSYEVNGELTLVLVDGQWKVDGIGLGKWSPELPY